MIYKMLYAKCILCDMIMIEELKRNDFHMNVLKGMNSKWFMKIIVNIEMLQIAKSIEIDLIQTRCLNNWKVCYLYPVI